MDGIQILRHTTGDNAGHRNYYCANAESMECEALVSAGLMRRGRTVNDGAQRYYIATDEGVRAVHRAIQDERDRAGLKRWDVWVDGSEWWDTRAVWAKTRSAARYQVASEIMECSDSPRGSIFAMVKVRRARG